MKTPIRFFALLFGSLLLAAADRVCASAFAPPPADNVKVEVSAASIGTYSTATVSVSVTRRNGVPEADGTVISATLSPPSIGMLLVAGDAPGGDTAKLVGGVASFVFVAGGTPGTATITVSVPPVNGHPASVTATAKIAVTASAENAAHSSLRLSTSMPALPQNPWGNDAQNGALGFPGNHIGSPYIAEVTLQWRGLVTGAPENGKVNVAIAPAAVALFSTLDDPATAWSGATRTPPTVEGNEFLTLRGSGTVDVSAGIGTIFVHAGAASGTATLTVSATDPDTQLTLSTQLTIDVVGASNGLPAIVWLAQSAGGVYINGANAPQSKLLTAAVTDSNGAAIADPASGVNNVQFQIVGPAVSDAALYALDAAGVLRSGKTVNARTYNGIANVSFLAGKLQGPVQIKATADGGDNNVDNGIADAISATTSVVVSDGQLYSLTLTSPRVNAVAVNGIVASAGAAATPAQPDATYSLTVSAIARAIRCCPEPRSVSVWSMLRKRRRAAPPALSAHSRFAERKAIRSPARCTSPRPMASSTAPAAAPGPAIRSSCSASSGTARRRAMTIWKAHRPSPASSTTRNCSRFSRSTATTRAAHRYLPVRRCRM
jgi:hypothetical protein